MKKTDFIEIKTLSIEELLKKVGTIKMELVELILDQNMKKQKDVKLVFKKRKDLAQVLTVLRQKQLLAELESKVETKEKKATGEIKAVSEESDKKTKLTVRRAKGSSKEKV